MACPLAPSIAKHGALELANYSHRQANQSQQRVTHLATQQGGGEPRFQPQPGSAPSNNFATLFNALTSIDQRLSRIEAHLKLQQHQQPPPPPQSAFYGAPQPPAPAPQAPTPPNLNAPHAPMQMAHAGRNAMPQAAMPPAAMPQNTISPSQIPTNQLPPNALPATMQPNTLSAGVNPALSIPHNPANGTSLNAPVFRPLEPPPEGFTISSRAAMQSELDTFTIPRGYSMRIAGAKSTGRKKIRWLCYRGGEARHHRAPVDESIILQAKAEGRRKPTTDRTSKKCGCLFKFEMIETTNGSDLWVLHYPNEDHKTHNHGPSDETSDPRARRLPPQMSAQVDRWLRDGMMVSKVLEELKSRGFSNVINTDLYNRKRLLKKEDSERNGG